jgi:hypothetical protein
MNRMLRPLGVGIAVGAGLAIVVLSVASLAGVPEDLFGALALVCTGIGSATAVILDGRARGVLPRKR